MARRPDRVRIEQAPKRVLTLYASLVKRGWLLRVIQLSGDLHAKIEYNGRRLATRRVSRDGPSEHYSISGAPLVWSEEAVRVNGEPAQEARYHSLIGDGLNLFFEISYSSGTVPARIRITHTSFGLPRIENFRLVVDGITVYEEARDGTIINEPSTLPLPSAAGEVGTSSLPVVGVASSPNGSELPIPGRNPDQNDD